MNCVVVLCTIFIITYCLDCINIFSSDNFLHPINRDDRLADSLNDSESLAMTIDFLSQYPQAKKAFLERPRLGNVDLQKLHQFDRNSIGYIYADRMIANGLTPLQAKPVKNDVEFFTAHITETHDIWHVVTGCDTNILGEIKLH
jgi:ubiquinone biosynthesis protein COQ4